MRACGPANFDARRWPDLDFTPGAETIHIERRWNAKVRDFTPPKRGSVRTIAMTPPVRERLSALPRESEWVFTTLRGNHYRPSSRSHHWNRVRRAAGLGNVDLYTATGTTSAGTPSTCWGSRCMSSLCTSATATVASLSARPTAIPTLPLPATACARRSLRRRPRLCR